VNKKIFLLAFILVPSMIFARVSKKDLCNKICCVQATANYLCQYTSSLNVSIIGLQNDVYTLDSRVDILESEMDDVESRLDVLESEMDVVETRLDVLESATTTLESRVDVLESRVDDLDATVGMQIIGDGTHTLDQADGYYIVQDNFTGRIIIDANNITLDLNNRKITSSTTSAVGVVQVNDSITGSLIQNGIIIGTGTQNTGVYVGEGADDAIISNVYVSGCLKGIECGSSTGADNILIDNCTITACQTSSSNTYGIYLLNCNNSIVKNCQITEHNTASAIFRGITIGYDNNASTVDGEIEVTNCIIKDVTITSGGACRSIEFENAHSSLYPQNSTIDNCIISSINSEGNMYGFFINKHQKTRISDNEIKNLTVTTTNNDVWGISLANSPITSGNFIHNNCITGLIVVNDANNNENTGIRDVTGAVNYVTGNTISNFTTAFPSNGRAITGTASTISIGNTTIGVGGANSILGGQGTELTGNIYA